MPADARLAGLRRRPVVVPHSLRDYVTACGRRNNSKQPGVRLCCRTVVMCEHDTLTEQQCFGWTAKVGGKRTHSRNGTGVLVGKAAGSRPWTQQDVDRLDAPMNLTVNVALHVVEELQKQVQSPHNPADAPYAMLPMVSSCCVANVTGLMGSHVLWPGRQPGLLFGAAGFAGTAQAGSTTFEMQDFSSMQVDSEKVHSELLPALQGCQAAQCIAGCMARNSIQWRGLSHAGVRKGRC